MEEQSLSLADLFGVWGETPKADAYTKQLTELKGQAAKCTRKAEECAEKAGECVVMADRCKQLAADVVDGQAQYIEVARKIRICTTITSVCVLITAVFAALHWL